MRSTIIENKPDRNKTIKQNQKRQDIISKGLSTSVN